MEQDIIAELPETTPSISFQSRDITFLNGTGDITLTWDPANEDAMLAMIEAKMKEGYSFFIIKPRLLGLLGAKAVKARSIKEIRKAGSVMAEDGIMTGAKPMLDDNTLEAVVMSGKAKLVKPSTEQKESTGRASSAREVVRSQSVAVRPIVAG